MASISIRLMFIALLIGVGNAQPPSGGCANNNVLAIIKSVVTSSVKAEPRMGASLLRLHFHDCFVQGCDASVLLDDNATISFQGEKTAGPNDNSLRGFDVIDKIKSQVEAACPRRISCADILAVAARDAVVFLGGQSWNVAFGRNDSTTASFNEANQVLPGPTSDLSDLIAAFKNKNFTGEEMVALSGSHTIGQARCLFFRNRIYSETNIDPKFANATRVRCPRTGGDDNLSPLDKTSPDAFNNDYYKNLVNMSGLFHSDQELFSNGSTKDARGSTAQVKRYAASPSLFAADFARAMAKMAALRPPSGAVGQIRTNCHRVN